MISLRSPPPFNDTVFPDQRGCARQTIAQLRRRLRPILGMMRGFGGVVVDLFERRAKPSGFARSTLQIATAAAFRLESCFGQIAPIFIVECAWWN